MVKRPPAQWEPACSCSSGTSTAHVSDCRTPHTGHTHSHPSAGPTGSTSTTKHNQTTVRLFRSTAEADLGEACDIAPKYTYIIIKCPIRCVSLKRLGSSHKTRPRQVPGLLFSLFFVFETALSASILTCFTSKVPTCD